MPRVPGRRRPNGGYEGGCGYLLGIFIAMWIGLFVLTHWDTIW